MGSNAPTRVCMGICNSVFADDTDRFAEYLKRLLNATNPSDPFTETEKAQLERAFGLTPEQLQCVTTVLASTFAGIAASGTPLREVAADLEAAGASEPVLTTIVAVWRAESPAFLKQLRGRQLGAPDVLHGVNWRIHVPMAGSSVDKEAPAELLGVLDLALGPPKAPGQEDPPQEHLLVEFTQQQLGEFFDKIEQIQEQLDAIA